MIFDKAKTCSCKWPSTLRLLLRVLVVRVRENAFVPLTSYCNPLNVACKDVMNKACAQQRMVKLMSPIFPEGRGGSEHRLMDEPESIILIA